MSATPSIDTRTAPYAALLLRVSLGALLLAHGLLLKVSTFGLAGTAGYFQSIGYPAFFAYLVILGEIGGGLALLLGLWTRWISLLLLPILIGATLQHAGNGWLFTAKGGGWEFPVFWTVTLVVQALLGDGAYALRPGVLFGRIARIGGPVTQAR
ncbi:DoxX family membrane protein [Rhodoplanes azumiensis]|uniref:DoxX family membrane protein n=1 Tax=Rhodoplanes azumiensis TaxID=1897628 RepID=A0ABW5AR99_9BRAD